MTLLVRPEDVSLARVGSVPPERAGRVVASAFLGAHARVHVALPSGETLVAQIGVTEAAGLMVGDTVEVQLRGVPALAV